MRLQIQNDEEADTQVSLIEAFLIMEEFLVQFGDRDQWSEDGLLRLRSFVFTGASSGTHVVPSDPAMWNDWKQSARRVFPDRLK